jgi:queuine tRNA-ribosyltransferase
MGVGTPEDLLHAVEHGIDMFDCVLPTRLGRHGIAFSPKGNLKMNNAKYKTDFTPLVKSCGCFACTHFTKAYISHLIRENEMLGGILLSLHNIAYLHNLLENRKKKMLKK